MKTIGLFEAKTKLSEICLTVELTKEPVLITKHGKPLVKIEPIDLDDSSTNIFEEAAEYHLDNDEDFETPERNLDTNKNVLEL
ncbi:MAG: type II toxin-antitoxin system Phd/YefM family antitoxin [Lentisphaeria bacterium]|nr:type II toxin-antitoxin system Phd/YefM family antitoxin [Lentisphaeria bacterium]NQZ66873.1 type II toxin-antitoxin system Phd/YefM family antitoxin [Lentisphaeria bacterium]